MATGIPGRPLYVISPPGQPGLVHVVTQEGNIFVYVASTGLRQGVFLNYTEKVLYSGEMGLLSVAYSPNYELDRTIYLSYISNRGRKSIVEEVNAIDIREKSQPLC